MVSWRRRSSEAQPRTPDVDKVIQPFEETILRTRTPPGGTERIEVETWGDLLKVSESLGKPILRLYAGSGPSDGRLFYVRDGLLSYVFEFAGAPITVARSGGYAPAGGPGPKTELGRWTGPGLDFTSVEVSQSAISPKPEVAPVVPPTSGPPPSPEPEPHRAVRPAPGVDPDERVREMTREILSRLRALPPTSNRIEIAVDQVRRALELSRDGRLQEAERELLSAKLMLFSGSGD